MALQKEIWLSSLIEGLFAENSFASRSLDHSEFVENHVVHVPNAGAGPNVEVNRSVFPASVVRRTDAEVTYELKNYTTDPIVLQGAETIELSYNKRESVIRMSRATLMNKVYSDLLDTWAASSGAITPSATVSESIRNARLQFDKDLIPQEGRYMILTPDSYMQLVGELTDAANAHFLAGADPVRGTIGKWMGFDIYERPIGTGAATIFAWWSEAVSRAVGEVKLRTNEDDPTWYGDVLSCEVRAGGAAVRSDGKGLLIL